MPANIDSKYKYIVQSRTGVEIADITGKVKSASYGFIKDGSYTLELKLDIDVIEQLAKAYHLSPRSIFSIGVNEIVTSRLGLPVYGGQIFYLDSTVAGSKEITVKCVGWLDLLAQRYTTISDVHTSEEQTDIAWDLITYTQGLSSLGITRGLHPTTGIQRNRTWEFKPIKDALIELSQVANGFDFEFTWDKTFNIMYPQMGVQHNEFAFTYPGNIKEFRVTEDASKLNNYEIVRGSGFSNQQFIDIRQDTPSQTAYLLRQILADYSDVIDINTLDTYGDADILAAKNPTIVLELTLDANRPPFFGSYWLGDRVPVTIFDLALFANVNGYYTIQSMTLDVDENDNETVKMKVTV